MDNHHVLGPATYPGTQQTVSEKKQASGHGKAGGTITSKGNQRWGPLKNFGRPSELSTNGNKQISRALTLSPDKRNMANAKRHGGYQNMPGLNGNSTTQTKTQHNSLCDDEDFHKDETQVNINTLGTRTNQDIHTPNQVAANDSTASPLLPSQQTAGIIVSQKLALKDKQIERDFRKLQLSEAYSQHYEFQKVLGEGAFCTVYQAVDKETNEQIAVKVIKRKTLLKEGVELLKTEAELLQSMDHKNIVKFKHFKEIKGKIFLGMELMRGGQLSELILAKKRQQKDFSDEEASQIIKAIFEAVHYLHSNEIVHRDLKPDNILIADPTDLSSLKVADFGLSAKYEHQSIMNYADQVGTLIFMSPELIQKRRYSPGVDVFAIGIVMYMLLTGGEHPVYDSDDFTTEKYKKSLLALSQFRFPEHLSPLASNLFHRLTKFNTSMRYTAHEALMHPWITRLNKTLIPMTLQDKIENMQTEHNFRSKIGMMLFLSNVSQSDNYVESSTFQDYKKLLKKVTFKIDKWYEKRQSGGINGEKFLKDEDFVELDQSPDKFESSSEEDIGEVVEMIAHDSEPNEESGKLDTEKLSQQNFLFGMSPDRTKESPRRSKEKQIVSEVKMRLHSTHMQQKSEEHVAKTNSSGLKTKMSKVNSTGVADSEDFSFKNKRNAEANFSQYASPLQNKEKSPTLRQPTGLNIQAAAQATNAIHVASPSPRKKNGKKKGLSVAATKVDDKGSSYLTNIGSTAVEHQTVATNAGIRSKNINSNGLYTQLDSQERISVQKSAKTAQKIGPHKVIKREDIVTYQQNKQFSASPKKAPDSVNDQASSHYYPPGGNDYDYQTPYKSSHVGVARGEKTDTDKTLNGSRQFHSDANKIQAKSGVANGTYYGIVGSFSKSERQNPQQDVDSSARQNESFERLYSSFSKHENGASQTPIRKKVVISSKKGPISGVSIHSKEFVDEERGDLREIRSNEVLQINGDNQSTDSRTQKPKGHSMARRNSQIEKIHDQNILSSDRRRRETDGSYKDFQLDSGQFNLEQSSFEKGGPNLEVNAARERFLSDEHNQKMLKQVIPDTIPREGGTISPSRVQGSQNFKTLGVKSNKHSHQQQMSEECYAASNSSLSEDKDLMSAGVFGEFEIKNLRSGGSKAKRKNKGQKRSKKNIALNQNGYNLNYSGLNSQTQKYQVNEDFSKPSDQSQMSHNQQRGSLGQRGNHLKDGVSRTQGNASISHQIAQSRFEVERKRNSGYDQKFLFKKNFIPKYQPNSTLPLNGPVPSMNSKVAHNQSNIGSGKKNAMGETGKRYDSNFKLKGNSTNKKNHTNVSFEDQDIAAIKNKSQPFSQRAGVIGHQNGGNFGFAAEQKNDLPRIDPVSNALTQQHSHSHKQKKMKSGSAKNDRSQDGVGAGIRQNSNQNGFSGLKNKSASKAMQDKELTAVRQRIGTILQNNNAHEEGSSLDLFGKDMIIKPKQNAVKLSGDTTGLAPPSTLYPKAQTSTDLTNLNVSDLASTTKYNQSNNEQSSETTMRSRNNGGGGTIFDRTSERNMKSNTHKISKKLKENDLTIAPIQPRNSNNNLPIQPVLRKDSLKQLSQSETKSMRQKNSSKVFMNSKLQEAQRNSELVPRPLDQRPSQPFGTQSTLIHTSEAQSNTAQQRTQSNPNNRVTAFIKIHHMPAEVLLSQQKPGPALHSNNPNGMIRSHHLNAMMGHSRVQHESQGHSKLGGGPYNQSHNVAKQWAGGRPVNGLYSQHQVQSPLMAEKSLIVLDSSKQQKNEANLAQDSPQKQGKLGQSDQMRQLNIARNAGQMSSSLNQGMKGTVRSGVVGVPQRSTNPAADSSGYYGNQQQSYQKGNSGSPIPPKNTMAPFIHYGPVPVQSSSVLEPGVGISGISINDKSFQNYTNFRVPYENQPIESRFVKSATKGGITNVSAAASRQQSLNHHNLNQVSSNSSPQNSQFLHSPSSALDTELLQHQNREFINKPASMRNQVNANTQSIRAEATGLNSLVTVQHRNHGFAIGNEASDVYQISAMIGNKSDQMFYGRQNSDQTACMRNMRSVLHQNGLQQKNNFINIGTQQIKSPSISSNQHMRTVNKP